MKNKSRYKAIFFDAGGTLFTPHPSVGEIYAETALRYGCQVCPQDIEKQFRIEWEKRDIHSLSSDHPEERQWWYDLVWDVFKQFEIQEYEQFFDELYDIFARPEYWRLFPEVRDVISQLKERGFILGIVSNWDSRLLPLCEKLGLGKYFDFILASGLVGSSKPHPGIFREALKRSNVGPHEALHVGDSLKDDVQGSRQLGIYSVLLDRTRMRKYSMTTVASLCELIPIIFSSY